MKPGTWGLLKRQVKVKVIIKNKFPVTGWQFYYLDCRLSGSGWLWPRHNTSSSIITRGRVTHLRDIVTPGWRGGHQTLAGEILVEWTYMRMNTVQWAKHLCVLISFRKDLPCLLWWCYLQEATMCVRTSICLLQSILFSSIWLKSSSNIYRVSKGSSNGLQRERNLNESSLVLVIDQISLNVAWKCSSWANNNI